MLSLLSAFTLAQVSPAPLTRVAPPQEVIVSPQDIRPLPGELNDVPVFNSNSPEVIYTDGILLSTFPPNGMRFPVAHLNHPLEGRFDIFSHHIARGRREEDWLPKYHSLLLYNPNPDPVVMNILQGVSYVTNPDAPFVDLPPLVNDPVGRVYSGPGSRLAGDVLRGVDQQEFPDRLIIPPGETQLLYNLPIHLGNARSTLVRVETSGSLYMASLAREGIQPDPEVMSHRAPTLEEWEEVLQQGYLSYPRDRPPTPLENTGNVIYGRVAGVSQGSQWETEIVDEGKSYLEIPQVGGAFSYPISTVHVGTLGTGQIQSAPMLVRYPDTAYQAHGNYGVHYYLTLPLRNKTNRTQTVAIRFQTPVKHDEAVEQLEFLYPPDPNIFFRGTVRVRYPDDLGILRSRYIHLIQKRGQQSPPLVTVNVPPGRTREVKVDFLYPPDATPPQVLTVETVGTNQQTAEN